MPSLRRLSAKLAESWRVRARRPWLLLAAALVVAAGFGLGGLITRSQPAEPEAQIVPYSALAAALEAGVVTELAVENEGTRLIAEFSEPRVVDADTLARAAAEIPRGTLELADLERWTAAGVTVEVVHQRKMPSAVVQFLVSFAALVLALFLVTRVQRGPRDAHRFGETPEARQLTLADVGGAREARADLHDVIDFLKDPERYQRLGARCPTGVLLVGPPGTGKTLLARAVAGEAGRPVLIASGAEFNERYVGVGASRVRELAASARAQAPCIVFIDEFDSIGGKRGRFNRSTEEETTLNQLLVEMDGMAGTAGVVWIAATNRDDMLDPAVKRPGRFDRVVEVGMPTASERLEILRVHAASRPLADDVNLDQLASLTIGYSGAELANLLNESAIIAVHEGSDRIMWAHVEQARDRIMLGRIRTGVVVSDAERRLIAIHEAGHTIVGLVACPEDRLHKVTIEARGRSLGAAHFAPDADRHLYSRRYLEGVLAKALGGRAAELEFFGPEGITSGAGADLVQATGVARRMVAEFGMSDDVGLVNADPAVHGGRLSAELEGQVDTAVRGLIAAQASRASAIVRTHRAAVEAVATALLERDVLSAEAVHEIATAHGVSAGAVPELVTGERGSIVAA